MSAAFNSSPHTQERPARRTELACRSCRQLKARCKPSDVPALCQRSVAFSSCTVPCILRQTNESDTDAVTSTELVHGPKAANGDAPIALLVHERNMGCLAAARTALHLLAVIKDLPMRSISKRRSHKASGVQSHRGRLQQIWTS